MARQDSDVDGLDLSQGISLSRLEEGEPLAGVVGDDEVVVVKRGEEIFAIGARCTHYGAPLEEGLVVEGTIRCPWHHAVFDLETGEAVGAPAFESTGCYPVEVEGDRFRVLSKKEKEARKRSAPGPASVVIVGAGAAAVAAVETLRQEGYRGAITMIGDEPSGPVDRPNLSKDYLAGDAPEEWIPLGSDAHWEELDVELVTGEAVVRIDRHAREVHTASGGTYDYEVLFYATGAEPVVPPIDGLASSPSFTLRSFGDAKDIAEAADQGDRALVVGAGFIGLEVAGSLRNRGVDVAIVAPEELPLARIMGEEIGGFVKELHEEAGEDFYLDNGVEKLEGKRAYLSNGEELEFDFVVLGTGVLPRVDVAEDAGLEVDDGVVVDSELRSSDDAIYAVGDVARYPDPIGGGSARIEHWVLAQRLAQRAARSVLGKASEDYTHIPFFWSRHHGVSISYVGHAAEFDEVVVAGSVANQDAAVGYLKGGKVLAVATIGRSVDSLRAEDALARGDQQTLLEILEG